MTAAKVLRKIEKSSTHRFLPIIGQAKGKLLQQLVQEKKPEKVLEIGTLVGYSGIKIVLKLPEKGKLVTLDYDLENSERAKENFEDAGVSKRVTMVFGDALKTIPKLKGKFDFVFIDAGKNQYLTYLKLLEKHKLLRPKAIILADNVKIFRVDVEDYLVYVRKSKKYRSNCYDFDSDAMEVSQLL